MDGAVRVDRFNRWSEAFSRLDQRRQVFCITENGKGTLWVGTMGGLNRFDRDRKPFTRYPTPGRVKNFLYPEKLLQHQVIGVFQVSG